MSSDSVSQSSIRRVVYREITAGDRRKFVAQSNDTASGGGARDLRFSPYERFGDVFARLFPNQRNEVRKRGGVMSEVRVLFGRFHWTDENNRQQSMESAFEPPTDARSFEGRIPKIHTYPCFDDLPNDADGIVLLLLIQDEDGAVWPRFVTEGSLQRPGWNRHVADRLLDCIRAKRGVVSVAGYMDFETGQSFCNGH